MPPPDELNSSQALTIVATGADPSTERIVTHLAETFDVPLNVAFFNYFQDDGRSYLARTWLVERPIEAAASRRTAGNKEPWNGRDWYVSFGAHPGGRSWEDAQTFGFVSAGGGEWFSRTLKNLTVGARVMACIPGAGYVGVGVVTRTAARFDQALVDVDGEEKLLAALALAGHYTHHQDGDSDEDAEYVVSVDWVGTVPVTQALRKPGMFANQNSACRLRQSYTLEQIGAYFALDDEPAT